MTFICLILLLFIISSWTSFETELIVPILFSAISLVAMTFSSIQRISLTIPLIYSVTIICVIFYLIRIVLKRNTININNHLIIYMASILVLCIFYALVNIFMCDDSAMFELTEYSKVSYVINNHKNQPLLSVIDSSGFRILDAWEFIIADSVRMLGNWGILLAKNIFLISMFLPLVSFFENCKATDYRFKRIAEIVVVALIMSSSTENELFTIKPYYINGLMFGGALVYALRCIETHEIIYALGSSILAIAGCLENRVGIYSMIAFIMTCCVIIALSFCCHFFRKMIEIKGKQARSLLMLFCGMAASVIIGALYAYRVVIVGEEPLDKDIFNTFLNALYTSYRYGFGIGPIKISVVYISIIMFAIITSMDKYYIKYYESITNNRFIVNILRYTLFIWFILVIMIVGGMYTLFWGRENANSFGEYLTSFENYIQCPVTVMLYFYGALSIRALASIRELSFIKKNMKIEQK